MRTLEVLKQIIHTFALKYLDFSPNSAHLTPVLRKQLLSGLLETIETYEYSSMASQISI
jgi:hypothetical protein